MVVEQFARRSDAPSRRAQADPGRKSALVQVLGGLGLALALDEAAQPTPEERLLREISLPATAGRFETASRCTPRSARRRGAPGVEELTERLGGARLIERIRTQRPAAERYPTSVARLRGS